MLECINPDNERFANTKQVSIENTANKGGGSCYDIEEIKRISKGCKENYLGFHLDGARLFNALVKTGDKPAEMGALFDSVSICLSKGLGAPVGSVLMGTEILFIKQGECARSLEVECVRPAILLLPEFMHLTIILRG